MPEELPWISLDATLLYHIPTGTFGYLVTLGSGEPLYPARFVSPDRAVAEAQRDAALTAATTFFRERGIEVFAPALRVSTAEDERRAFMAALSLGSTSLVHYREHTLIMIRDPIDSNWGVVVKAGTYPDLESFVAIRLDPQKEHIGILFPDCDTALAAGRSRVDLMLLGQSFDDGVVGNPPRV
jgi:hypothetical protein